MTQITKKVQYIVHPKTAQTILREVYGVNPDQPIDKKRFTPIEVEEIEQLFAIINRR